MRAVFVDCTPELLRVIEALDLPRPENVTINRGNPSPSDLAVLCSGYDTVFVEHTVIPDALFDRCPTIRAVVFMGTGIGTYVDVERAGQRGISLATTPGYGDRAVAEHALALMFAAARNITAMDRGIRSGEWRPTGGLELYGAKLAILGMGGIGTCLADLAAGIGMRVSGWNRTPLVHSSFEADIELALQDADVISLHFALNPETNGMIGERLLALPRRGFILVNTARAALVDEPALFKALASGQIGHAALDVFPDEPLPAFNPYMNLPNTTLTAHAAYMTDAAYAELWKRTLSAFERLAA